MRMTDNCLLVFTCQVSAVFDRNDKDGDGKLSRKEFKDMMMKRRVSQ